jgi:hypothetical protein
VIAATLHQHVDKSKRMSATVGIYRSSSKISLWKGGWGVLGHISVPFSPELGTRMVQRSLPDIFENHQSMIALIPE